MNTILCPLCHSAAEPFFKHEFLRCTVCLGLFRPLEDRLPPDEEKAFYGTHENDVNDIRYQNFVSPITDAIQKHYGTEHLGLDFGAGTGPVITHVLRSAGYKIEPYDPFFIPDTYLLSQKYDYIACCEVMEHFHNPDKEFALLKSMLKAGGRLFCMTNFYTPDKFFSGWRYKDDPTHVFLYDHYTIEWIMDAYHFQSYRIENRFAELVV